MPKKKSKQRANRRLAAPQGSVTNLDGYRAAAIAVENMLDAAGSKLPKRCGGREHLAAWKEGYYDGLLAAHCQFALGEFPQHNMIAIQMILSQNKELSLREPARVCRLQRQFVIRHSSFVIRHSSFVIRPFFDTPSPMP